MCMECNRLVEVLITEGFDSTSPRAMEEAENPNSGSSSAKDVDMDETSEKPSKGKWPPPHPPKKNIKILGQFSFGFYVFKDL